MPEPKTDPTLRLERSHNFGNGDVVGVLRWADHIMVWLDRVPPDAWAALEAALTENAGLREALEASQAERDRLRMQREQVWQSIDLWADDPDTNVDQLLDVWASHEKVLAERDAMRPVVEAAVAWRQQLAAPDRHELLVFGADVGAQSYSLIAAVDSYTQSSNSGES